MRNRQPLRVLSFTTLFPNRAEPLRGVFIKNRLKRMASLCDLAVVAPINILKNPQLLWKVPLREPGVDLSIYHPRFGVIPGILKHWDANLLFWQTAWQMRGILPMRDYDLLDVHYAYPDGVAGQYLAQELNKPFVVSLRGSDINVLTQFPRRRQLIEGMLGKAAAVISVSKALGRQAQALGADPRKIHVIPNGVENRVFYPRERMEARQRLGWPLYSPVILSVGRLVSIKGFDMLIRVLRQIRDQFNHSPRCYIVGDGELRPRLAKKIAELGLEGEVILSGLIPPEELPLWYSAANLFCLLSENEGCPNVVLESLACGTPVVATAVGGLMEIVRDGETGFLVTRRNEEEAAVRIARALEIRWSQSEVKKNAAIPDWDAVARVQMQVMEEVRGQLRTGYPQECEQVLEHVEK